MPLTPEFSIRQDTEFLYFEIRCPNVCAKEMELLVVGSEFHFFADPYLLVLHFGHRLVESERCSAEYDLDSGFFRARIEKAVRGEDFPEILLFTTLKPKAPQRPLVEVVSRSEPLGYIDEEPDPSNYGFAQWATNFFENLDDVIPYVTDVPNPDRLPLPGRRTARIAAERAAFDPDHVIHNCLNSLTFSVDEVRELRGDFTREQARALYEIPRREFLMSRDTARKNFLSISDVVFACVYDTIVFGIQGSCESHWTIAKISPTLAWFDLPISPPDVVLTVVRRCLVYPLLRNYSFAKLCWEQTVELFKEGKTPILKALLRARTMVEKAEHRWRLNRLYIEPMICWIQDLDEREFATYVDELVAALLEFPPREAIDSQWCIELIEKYAEKLKREVPVAQEPVVTRDMIVAGECAKE
jgi:protein SHQ1